MELGRVATEWLYQCGVVPKLLRQCSQLRQTDTCIYKLTVNLDACELLQFNVLLGEALLHQPGRVWEMLVEVVFNLVSAHAALPLLSSSSQLLLIIRLSSLPALPLYQVDCVSDLPPLTARPRFYSFSGVVTAMSARETYTEAACFHCSRQSCPDNQRYVRLHTAGATEAVTMQDAGCLRCGHRLTEDLSYRRLADKVYMILVPRHALGMCSKLWGRHQGMVFVLRSDLCDLAHVGGEYEVIGVPTPTEQHSLVIEVNNLLPVGPPPPPSPPATLRKLLDACSDSPWRFSTSLAHSFAGHICPPGTYHRVKLAILLSLVSVDLSRALNLLLVGSDVSVLGELLLYGSSLATRSTVHSSNFELCGGVRKEGLQVFVDGGALALAEGGVCLLGNVGAMKRELRNRLQRTLESGQVDVSIPKRFEGSEVQVLTFPVRCAVWSVLDQSDVTAISKSFLDRLDLVLHNNPSTCHEDHLTFTIATHVLDRATGHMTTPILSHDHFKDLVTIAATVEPYLDAEAEVLLGSFYHGSRRVRDSDMPNCALETMRAITLAHAKLNLKQMATRDDALVAILLYEECLAGRFSYSVLNLSPCPHVQDCNDTGYTRDKCDAYMMGLMKRVAEFCKCSTPAFLNREE